jgi:nanoRNase/pAp phosphatase (c-di-AMP/oligoRNAs hydrolase)
MNETGTANRGHWRYLIEVVRASKDVLILTHDNPDPDALASAEGLRHLLQVILGRRIHAAYGGIIGRVENRTMLEILKLRLEPFDAVKSRTYDCYVLVDTQPKTGNNSLPLRAEAKVVIDHHPRIRGWAAPYTDVREEYGATSTIMTEYLQEAGLKIPTRLATALFYGIASDTKNLGRQSTEADAKAYMSLFSQSSTKLLSRIASARLPKSYFVHINRALGNAFICRNVIGSRLGMVDNPDVVAECADLLLRHEGATWSICLGCWGKEFIISVRTSNPRADAGRIVRRLLGRKGRAGGHEMMAAGRMSCPAASQEDRLVMEEKIIRRFLKLLGKKEAARLEPLIDRDAGGLTCGNGSAGHVR